MVGDSLAGSPYSGRTPLTASPAGMQQMGMRDGAQGSPSQGLGICCGREEQGGRPPPWDPNKLVYKGERRGTYRRVVQYEYVGDGMGDFDMPVENVPEPSSCGSTCCCCCLLAFCILAAGIAVSWRYEWPVPISQVEPALGPLGPALEELLGVRPALGGDADAALVDCAANDTTPNETAACCNRTAGQGLGCSENATSSTMTADSSSTTKEVLAAQSTSTAPTSSTVDAAAYCKDIDAFSEESDMKTWCCENAAVGCTAPNATKISSSIGAAKSAAAGATKWVSGSNGTQPDVGNASPKAAGAVDTKAPDSGLGAAARSDDSTTTDEAPVLNSSWGGLVVTDGDQAPAGGVATTLRQTVTPKATTTTTPRPTETSSLTTTTEDQTAKCYKKGEWSPETKKVCCEALNIGCAFSEDPSADDGQEQKKRPRRRL